MTKLKNSEKSKGALIFAFNTTDIDYVNIATQAAKLVKHFLNIPVTLVTDNKIESDVFDSIQYVDNTLVNVRSDSTQWRNGNRFLAYTLSPYDTTILIDSDYLIFDSSLNNLIDVTNDYQIMGSTKCCHSESFNLMSKTGLEQVWATVLIFNKTEKSKMLFELVELIQNNYNYYRLLYQISVSNFRNDFAFAIANHIINGYNRENTMSWPMLTIEQKVEKLEVSSTITIREFDKAIVIPRQCIHVMDKIFLASTKFAQTVEQVCNE
jgi:hypothetical protein